jgi:hypothetical protein
MMVADRPYGEFYDFYSVSPEYFGLILIFVMRTVQGYDYGVSQNYEDFKTH